MKTILSLVLLASALFGQSSQVSIVPPDTSTATSKPDPKDAEIAALKAQIAVLNATISAQYQVFTANQTEIADLRKTYFDKLNAPIIQANESVKTANEALAKTLAESCKVKPDIDGCPKKP